MDETSPPIKEKKKPRGSAFKKGEYDPRRAVGNNARRTKDGKTVTSLARQFTEEALMKQVELMRDPNVPAREQLKASEYILSRGWGAPKQSIEMTSTVEHEVAISIVDWDSVSLEAKLNLLQHIQTIPEPTLAIEDASYSIVSDQENDDSEN